MRIAVLGAGAMGGVLAALLDRAGHEVEVTARGEHLTAIQREGLLVDGGWGEHRARVTAGPRLGSRPELAIVTMKAMDAATAAAEHASLLDGVPVVVVQNGFGGLERVAEALPRSRVVGGLSMIAASFVEPGHVRVTTPAMTLLGMVHAGADDAPARFAAEVLGAVVPVELTDDLEGARWTKLIVNQVNALPAITGLSVQEVIDHRGLRLLMTRSMREAVRIALARGVRFAPLSGMTHARLRRLGHAPLWFGQRLPLALRRYLGEVPNPGSTLQSLRRGQATEIDYLNGAVVAVAREAGRDAPVNAVLTELVHEVERTGRFLPPLEVLDRVRAALRRRPRRGARTEARSGGIGA